MPQLLIEDLAKKLGKDPQQLSAIEFKKYLILIDGAIALETDAKRTPYLVETELKPEKLTRLMDALVKGINEGAFASLDKKKPDSGDMDDAFIALGNELGLKEKAEKMVNELETAMMKDYEDKIQKNAYLYTNYLTYKTDLTVEAMQGIDKANARLNMQYEKLRNAQVFTAKRTEIIKINTENNQLEIKDIEQLNPSKKYTKTKAADTVYFYLDIMSTLKEMKEKHKLVFSPTILNALNEKIKPYINLIAQGDNQIENIGEMMRSLMPKDSQDKLKSNLAESLSDLMMNHKALRTTPFINFSFKKFEEVSIDVPIHRAILIGPEDLANDEVLRSMKMMLKNHPDENIVVTFKALDIDEINAHNKKLHTQFTLNVVGHGSLKGVKELNANLGPFRGTAGSTGKKLADVVNRCFQINHLRVTGCFTGLINEKADLRKYQEKQRPDFNSNSVRKTFTMVSEENLTENNSPFVDTSVAINCWNHIDKNGREISMTVSPGIIEPDEEIGRMVWKPSATRRDEGIKEIRITTPEGPKNRLKNK